MSTIDLSEEALQKLSKEGIDLVLDNDYNELLNDVRTLINLSERCKLELFTDGTKCLTHKTHNCKFEKIRKRWSK